MQLNACKALCGTLRFEVFPDIYLMESQSFLVLTHTNNCHCTQLASGCQSLLTYPTHLTETCSDGLQWLLPGLIRDIKEDVSEF